MSALSVNEFLELYSRQYQNCLLIDVQSPLSLLKLSGAIKRAHLSHYLNWATIDVGLVGDLLLGINDCRTTVVDFFIFYDEVGNTSGFAAKLAMMIDHFVLYSPNENGTW